MPGEKGLDVDRRVGIALGALAHGQRLVVGRILQSTRRFAASVANEANVKTINGGDPPLYSLRVTPELRLVYEKSGNGFRVVDLVDRATIERFSAEKARKKASSRGLKGSPGAPKVPSRKVGGLVEK
jgi:hypothetical protein